MDQEDMSTVASASPRLEQYNAAIAAADKDPTLSPETGKPFGAVTIARYGAAFLGFGILWMIGINSVSAFIIPLRLKQMVPNPEAVIAINGTVSSVFSLLSNLIFGNFSDRTRSHFGRRTPWIVIGSLIGGIFMFLTGMAPNAFLMVLCFGLAMAGLNMMIAPVVAMISDRVPSGIRGTMSAFYGAGSTVGAPLGTLLATKLMNNQTASSISAGAFMLVSGLLLLVLVPREKSADFLPKTSGGLKDILVSFTPPRFKTNHDFYKAFAGRLCMLMGYQMIAAYQLYIITDHVGQSNTKAAETMSVMSIISMVVSLAGPAVSGPLSDFLGRRKVPVVIASVLFAIGVAMPWVMPTTMGMYLYAGIAGLGYGVYSSVDQALNVDVLSDKETAGKDLGILNLATTLGQMIGPVLTSTIVMVTGGYPVAFAVSICMAILGSVFILSIKSVR
ncbi:MULTISPECIES: MFS transporter [unclassified Bifidobacterium]|uniref:MFS transporter n=1 Tax=unclassified Bifidobacterium TaxID=2608897 RepID=UPI0023F65447|nr:MULTISPECIES: MFS transporter [unclassified Bifidobacterium]WEV66169.1 MFS transporter [Bifidobacterium sp. ESL0764]WEV75044.1 MFS transporter [Bifidobacterium sp. ESL0800]